MKRIFDYRGCRVLGSHLCDRFIHEGYHVIGMDNFLTGSEDNISHLFPLPNFEFYHHDVSKFVHVAGELDYILHFASPASPIDYLQMPIQTLKVGSLGTHNLLGLANAKNARMMIASTSEVYGDPLVQNSKKNVNIVDNAQPHWSMRRMMKPRDFKSAITMAYHNFHKLDTQLFCIFNTCSSSMRVTMTVKLPVSFFSQSLAKNLVLAM